MSNNTTSFYINLAGNVAQQANRFGGAISAMASRSNRALAGVKRVVAGVSAQIDSIGNRTLIAGAGMTYAFNKTLVRAAADVEMANIRMKQTFGADSGKAMAYLTQIAAETTLEFGETQDAMMRLKTAGIDPMNGSLQALIDYNAKVGGNKENLDGYLSAISKGFIKGQLSMEEINPLLERNVKVFEILAAQTGGKLTADQIKEMALKGKLGRASVKALLKGMGEDAKGASKEQMKTWDGMVSNLGDTFTAMQARFMEKGAFDHLKKELGGVLDWLNEKMENGEFDKFAEEATKNLIDVLTLAKDSAIGLKEALEAIGDGVQWLAELSGGYDNLAKILVAVYAANKVLRSGFGQTVMGGAWGAAKWGVGKIFKRKKGVGAVADAVSTAAGAADGVQLVYVTNFGDLAGLGFGGKNKKGNPPKSKKPKPKPQPNKTQPQKTPAKTAPTPKPQMPKVPVPNVQVASPNVAVPKVPAPNVQVAAPAVAVPKVPAPNVQVAVPSVAVPKTPVPAMAAQHVTNAAQNAAQSAKAASTAAKATTTAVKSTTIAANSAVKGVARSVPLIGNAASLAMTASVLLDEEASIADKSEAVGSAAGAAVGAVVGQALIPIPVVGAMIGGFVGNWLGDFLGGEVGKALENDHKPQKVETETKLDGQIAVKITAPQGFGVVTQQNNLNVSGSGMSSLSDSLLMSVKTGNTGVGIRGGV